MSQETSVNPISPNRIKRSFQATKIASFTESRRQRFLSLRKQNRESYFGVDFVKSHINHQKSNMLHDDMAILLVHDKDDINSIANKLIALKSKSKLQSKSTSQSKQPPVNTQIHACLYLQKIHKIDVIYRYGNQRKRKRMR